MKVYRKRGGKILVLTNLDRGLFGGTEVVFMNYSLKGTLQSLRIDLLKKHGVSNEDIETIKEIVIEAGKRGDVGSCVLGSGLFIGNDRILDAWCQGNLGPEQAYVRIEKLLIANYPHLKIEIEFGNMD